MTFNYAESSVVIGALAPRADPGSYDLCEEHAKRQSAPRGWQIVRLPRSDGGLISPDDEDLMALANAIREVGRGCESNQAPKREAESGIVDLNRRRHLRVIADTTQAD